MNYLGQPLYALVDAGGSGDIIGPSSSTENAIARFAGTDGKEIKDSVVTISDTGVMEGVFTIRPRYVSSPDYLIVEAVTDVIMRAAGSSVKVDTDVVTDTDGTVSLTGRASPYGIALAGDTVLAGNLNVTGTVESSILKKTGGTSSQYLMADGSSLQYSANSGNSNFYLYKSHANTPTPPPTAGLVYYNNNDQNLLLLSTLAIRLTIILTSRCFFQTCQL